jgi:alpha-ketoglutarate-dependent taurine dioxygenase
VRGRELGRRTTLSDSQPGDNCAVHALVGRQEGTGRPYLFACMDMAALVIGLSEPASDALLEQLFEHLYAAENVYEHHWRNGDLIVWNNRAIQHARSPIEKGRRTLQRVAIAELGYWDQCPADLKTFDDLQRVKNKAA